jgi:hypothetical protein
VGRGAGSASDDLALGRRGRVQHERAATALARANARQRVETACRDMGRCSSRSMSLIKAPAESAGQGDEC